EAAYRMPEGIYGVFAELERRDAHLFAILQTRKNALVGWGWQLVWREGASQWRGDPASAAAVERMVRMGLEATEDFAGALYHLLDALAKGLAVLEIVWRRDPATGGVSIRRLVPCQPWEFAFDVNGNLYRLSDEGGWRAHWCTAEGGNAQKAPLMPRPGEFGLSHRRAECLPERKFVVFVPQPAAGSFYGTPLAARVYWYSWFKRRALEDWSNFNATYATPTPVGRYAATTSSEDVDRLVDALSRLREHAGIVVPETVTVELLEARRAAGAGASPFRELADWCNDEMSKVVLGQTLTTTEGRRSGSLALGRVHEAVRRDYLAADARALGQALTRQLVRWLVDFNYGLETPAPMLTFEVDQPEDMKTQLEVDRGLVQLGVPLGVDYFYRRYRRPTPTESERRLKYDDANFYQYHLQYGVLTINEVRAALGLPRVPWGDCPPAKLGAAQSAEADATTLNEPQVDRLEGHRDVLPR
ncbi:MAG: DUF935 domain-containing protein, partial [Candidatus Sumerlaeaceae bacterium]|nr:DUF935 domain-containing protein [Candidatus Sumerlaeaceae bacterium]